MTDDRSHQFMHEAGMADRYAAGRMPDAERIAFENHFVTCAQCQRDMRFASAVRSALAESRTGAPATRVPVARVPAASAAGARRSTRWAGAALAAGIGALILVRAVPSRAMTALGALDHPPAYLGIAVRSATGPADATFETAMREYAAADYVAATRDLRAALAAGEDSIPTEFFIGASLLFSGDAAGAAPVFARVAAKGESPYRDEAQWYEAKALLRRGRAADARAVLTASAPADPAMAARLAALADSVTRATR
jgi:hypothetical protein